MNSLGMAARRPTSFTPRRLVEHGGGPFGSTFHQHKAPSSPFISFCVILLVAIMFLVYIFGTSSSSLHSTPSDGGHGKSHLAMGTHHMANDLQMPHDDADEDNEALTRKSGVKSSQSSCQVNVCQALPLLQDAYGSYMHRMLHIGPGTCGVVSRLLREENIEAWGIQPFEMQPPIHKLCNNFIQKGIVRVADVFRPLPYRARSFSLVLVTDTLEHLSTRQLNRTLEQLPKLSSHSLVVFLGMQNPKSHADFAEGNLRPVKHRSRAWWLRQFEAVGLQEDGEIGKRFEDLQLEKSFKPEDEIFHLLVPESLE